MSATQGPGPIRVLGSGEGGPAPPSARWAWVVLAAVAVVAVAVIGRSAPDERLQPDTDSTTTTSSRFAEEGPTAPPWWETSSHTGPLATLPGWVELDIGPIGDRFYPAVTWTGSEILVWGGDRFESRGFGSMSDPVHDGFRYHPVSGTWSPMAPLPDEVCRAGGGADLVAAGEVVILRLGADELRGGCTPVAAYHIADGAWEPLREPFFMRALPGKPLVWTGELLVSPRDGLAYRWDTAETIELPLPPGQSWPDAAADAHWSGEEVVVAGSVGILAWSPGSDTWRVVDPDPIPAGDFGFSMGTSLTSSGLLAVDPLDGARFHRDGGWRPTGLPLGHMCYEVVVPVAVPLLTTCLGYLMWDPVGERWVPLPAPALRMEAARVVVADGEVYAVGPGLHRLVPTRDPGGLLTPPATVPLGHMFLEVPDGMTWLGLIGEVRHRTEGEEMPGFSMEMPLWESRTVVLGDDESGTQCRATVTAWFDAEPAVVAQTGDAEALPRPGLPDLLVRVEDDGERVALVVGGDWQQLTVICEGDDAATAARRIASGLWEPTEGQFWYYAPADNDVIFTDDGEWVPAWSESADQTRSRDAQAIFLACVESQMGDGFALSRLRLIVDGENNLVELTFSGVRPGATPPVSPVPDETVDRCLERAGTGRS